MFFFGLAGTIYLLVSQADLHWKALALVLFVLGLLCSLVVPLEYATRLMFTTTIFGSLGIWGLIHWRM